MLKWEKLKALIIKSRVMQVCTVFIVLIQCSIGSNGKSNWGNGKKRHQNQKGGNKIIRVCTSHGVVCEILQKLCQNV